MCRPALLSRSSITFVLVSALLMPALSAGVETRGQVSATRTPTETVREFYKALREKRFREAFALSIYKPAVEGLSAEEFDELRPDFDKMAAAVPANVAVSGEQISGDTATVFVKIASGDDAAAQAEPITLLRENGVWIIGDKENEKVVRASGKEFFIKARIDTHHGEVQSMLERINLAELAYSAQHNGLYADLAMLITAGLVPKDLEATESTGYRFHVALAPDKKSFTAGAEPAQYGRTGRLSFYLDRSGIKSKDVGGKPLVPPLK
jgi:hypothetical protein